MSFPYFAEDDEVDYVLGAVHFVAKHGWKLLPQYDFSCRMGVWHHVSWEHPEKKRLSDMPIDDVDTVRSSVAGGSVRDLAVHR
ncbi:hypothetical protein P3T76_001557 [Phytophthora citrophthora]|uniref:Uncharacterized protein n=1 Tax=Phytophthora citrophthora TaxID=4793 RepID=A0AAD9GZ79_9STRA|nr:hypothetical protein P3T76_001557 [Phytophthora citrophthora]